MILGSINRRDKSIETDITSFSNTIKKEEADIHNSLIEFNQKLIILYQEISSRFILICAGGMEEVIEKHVDLFQ